jgi:glycosyltransferase involved in cell wall biosynthesis
MRILHVVPTYLPALRYGGPIYSVHSLATALVGREHEVHVYTTNVDGPDECDVPLGQSVDVDGVRVWYYSTGIGRRLYRSPTMGQALQSRLKKFDIVHLHSVFLWPTLAAARIACDAGVPYIVAPRGMLVTDLIRRKSSLAKRTWIGMFERRNLERSAAIHVTSEIEASQLKELGFYHRRFAFVPNGTTIPSKDECWELPTAVLGQRRARPTILFLGRVNWKKGLDRLIPAMAHIPEAELVIAGNDEENYQATLLAMAAAADVADRVRFLGFVNGTEKLQLLRKAHMLVLPSYSENFGNVVLEAMAAGCPVVVTPEVGLSSIVKKANAGLVVEGNPEQLGRAINELLKDDNALRKMGASGRRIAREEYSWETIAERMEQVYQQCIFERQRDAGRHYAGAPNV